jgi:hypothetical protein
MKFEEAVVGDVITDGTAEYKVESIVQEHINNPEYPACKHPRYINIAGSGFIWKRLFDNDLEQFWKINATNSA